MHHDRTSTTGIRIAIAWIHLQHDASYTRQPNRVQFDSGWDFGILVSRVQDNDLLCVQVILLPHQVLVRQSKSLPVQERDLLRMWATTRSEEQLHSRHQIPGLGMWIYVQGYP